MVHREGKTFSDLVRTGANAVTLIGGVLLILGAALGLTNYLIFADIPGMAIDWVQSFVASPLFFLLLLNIFLLIVGCLMDIYSAIVVVVPLVAPLGLAFGIDPLHLGVIFLTNLELGYLTPPVGMNLFLASYRFKRPLGEVYRASVPFLLIRGGRGAARDLHPLPDPGAAGTLLRLGEHRGGGVDFQIADRQRKRRVRRLLLAGGGAAALLVVFWLLGSIAPGAPEVDRAVVWTGVVERGELVRQVRGPGSLQVPPEQVRWLAAETRGRIEERRVLPGTPVEEDTVLLVLSNPELEQQTRKPNSSSGPRRRNSGACSTRRVPTCWNSKAPPASSPHPRPRRAAAPMRTGSSSRRDWWEN